MADLFTVFIVFAFLEGHMVGVTQCVPFSDGKESAWKDGDLSLIPGLGRTPGREHDKLIQHSCLENPMDRGAWLATVHRVTQSWT